jgi:competence protein ComFC
MENFVSPILIPIPLSKKRRRERGFNQAELLCREIIKIQKKNRLTPDPSPYQGEGCQRRGEVFTLATNILIKIKETEHQALIKDRNRRLKNLEGTFAVKNHRPNEKEKANFLKGKNIILIDDITTTGATLSEARRMLRASGARKVIAFTVAH